MAPNRTVPNLTNVSADADTYPPPGGALVLATPTGEQDSAYSADFEAFWAAYPRKLEKKATWRAWRARRKSGVAPGDMIRAAEHYAAAKRQQGAAPEHIKHAATFIGRDEHYLEFVAGIPAGEARAGSGKTGTTGRREGALDQIRRLAGLEETA